MKIVKWVGFAAAGAVAIVGGVIIGSKVKEFFNPKEVVEVIEVASEVIKSLKG